MIRQDTMEQIIRSQQEQIAGLLETNRSLVESNGKLHIPADTRSAFPVISVQSPVSIQCCWQS